MRFSAGKLARHPVAVLLGLGVAARLWLLWSLWRVPVDPDGQGYLALARRFSFLEPWAASEREPLWIAAVKVATAPFGYRPQGLRVFGVAVGVVGLAAAWALLSRVAPRRVALVALGMLAVHPMLVYDSVRGLREPLSLLLMIPVFALLLDPTDGNGSLDGLRRLAPVSLVALPLVRWELAAIAVLLAAVAVLRRSMPWRRLALTGAAAVLLVAPWLVANQSRYGDAMYHSNRNAIYLRNLDIVYRDAPGPRPNGPFSGPHITWAEYYLDFVGPQVSAVRAVTGTPENVGALLGATPVPLWPGWPSGTGLHMTEAARWAAVVLGTFLAGAGVLFVRDQHRRAVRNAAAIVLVDAVAYGAISRWVEYRLLSWALPMLALVLAAGFWAVVAYRASTSARNLPV